MADQLQTLVGVLDDKLLVVADYQRPYAWQLKQLRDLWDDLDLLGTERHYAGTLVLQRTDAVAQTQEGKDVTTFEVVDGQQRLTTCLILLDQIRRHLNALAGRDLPGVDDALIDLRRLLHVTIGGVRRPRLTLGAELQRFFSDSILHDEVPDRPRLLAGEQRLQAAATFFGSQIAALVDGVADDVAADRLVDLRARVCFRLRFLVYDVDSNAEVGVLFETLNERGQNLSELEKVKNYLLYLSRQIADDRGPELATRINNAWSEIFLNLADVKVDDDALLRSHWLATASPDPRQWRRIASIKARFPRATYVPGSVRLMGASSTDDIDDDHLWQDLVDDVTLYVETLRKSSAYLRDIYTEGASYLGFAPADAARVRGFTAALVRGGAVANFRPLLLASRLAHPRNGRLYGDVVALCETFSARVYAIGGLRSNAGESALSRAAHDLYRGEDPSLILRRIAEALWRLAPDDAVRAGFGAGVEWYYRRSHKYVLYEYEYEYELALARSASDLKPFQAFQDSGVRKTTEHVLPQSPANGSQWWRDFTPEQHQKLHNGLGNLVLTYDNSAYSNFDYSRKRGVPGQETPRCYHSLSALARERELAQVYSEWTPASIDHRRQAMEEWALARWPARPGQAPAPEEHDDLDDDSLDDEGTTGQTS